MNLAWRLLKSGGGDDMLINRFAAFAGLATAALLIASPAGALTMAECSAKYNVAKAAGTLDGRTWNQFRKAECGSQAADDETVPAIDEATYTSDPDRPTTRAPRGVTFPSAVSRKYSGERPGKARMRTCLDQYYANKDAGALNGLRWIQKGGGYYSLCNARLKG